MARNKNKPVAVLLTLSEISAIVEAAALHEAQYEDDSPTPHTRAVDRALDRVIAKIHHAQEGP